MGRTNLNDPRYDQTHIMGSDKAELNRVRDIAMEQLTTIARQAKRIEELEAFAQLCSERPHCGCRPCRLQCESQEALKAHLDGLMDTAKNLLAKEHADG